VDVFSDRSGVLWADCDVGGVFEEENREDFSAGSGKSAGAVGPAREQLLPGSAAAGGETKNIE